MSTSSSLRPEPQPLFPTMGSLQAVMELAETQLPIESQNDLTVLLMTYHNTLLAQLRRNRP